MTDIWYWVPGMQSPVKYTVEGTFKRTSTSVSVFVLTENTDRQASGRCRYKRLNAQYVHHTASEAWRSAYLHSEKVVQQAIDNVAELENVRLFREEALKETEDKLRIASGKLNDAVDFRQLSNREMFIAAEREEKENGS